MLSDEDEAYLVKELVGGRCTLQYSEEDPSTLERVVAVANVMLSWDETGFGRSALHAEDGLLSMGLYASETEEPESGGRSNPPSPKERRVLYQIGRIDEANGTKKPKLALHIPGTKRKTGETPQAGLERVLSAELLPFKDHMRFEGSERVVNQKDGTQTLKMRTKTVKTVYKATLTSWPEQIESRRVEFPDLPGLRKNMRHQDLLLLPQSSNQVGLYAFLQPKLYATIESASRADSMKKWIASLDVGTLPPRWESFEA
mmetsp:Transcript_22332/g.52047  ORF Transcript_22332/g.52047 Transcript_22332/m.52047 type:complete len:258 (+) Transcript_22332:2-775(+)